MADAQKPVDPEKEKRKIKSVSRMKEIMTNYYIEAKTARDSGKKVAWITSGGPVEPLIAMDVIPVYPENHGAMIGASKMGVDLCEKAEEMGYSRDLCSYARADIACAPIHGGPIGGLPDPDFLVCCNNICGTVLKWYEVVARHYNVPLFILDTPFVHKEMADSAKQYVIRQIHEYIEFLETHCGKKADLDRMEEVGRLSVEATRLWQAVLDVAAHKPAPMTAFDAFFHLALIVTLRGTRTCVDYYKGLLSEMKERIEQGIAWFGADFDDRVIPHEAGLDTSHISYVKGCYTGQEIVERVRSRGQVNRRLSGLAFVGAALPELGAKLFAGDKEAGWLTSAAFSPRKNCAIGLGYLRREFRQPGSRVHADGREAEIISLPLESPPK